MATNSTSAYKQPWMNLRTALDAGIPLPSDSSSKKTSSSYSHHKFWVGARTQLPLYVLLTPARTVASEDTGHPNAPTGPVRPARKSRQDMPKKTVRFALVVTAKSDLSLSALAQLRRAIRQHAQTATSYSLEPLREQ